VNGKSKKVINITFKPTTRFNFNIRLSCSSKEKPSKELQSTNTSKNSEITLIEIGTMAPTEKYSISILAQGDYPLLRFTDVRNDQLSTSSLWERFSLTTLNKELLKPLNHTEVSFNQSDKTDQKSV
jgi:hypothetical protein